MAKSVRNTEAETSMDAPSRQSCRRAGRASAGREPDGHRSPVRVRDAQGPGGEQGQLGRGRGPRGERRRGPRRVEPPAGAGHAAPENAGLPGAAEAQDRRRCLRDDAGCFAHESLENSGAADVRFTSTEVAELNGSGLGGPGPRRSAPGAGAGLLGGGGAPEEVTPDDIVQERRRELQQRALGKSAEVNRPEAPSPLRWHALPRYEQSITRLGRRPWPWASPEISEARGRVGEKTHPGARSRPP